MKFNVSVTTKQENEEEKYQFNPGKVNIGRRKDNDITLNFPAVSSYHGELNLVDNKGTPNAYISDLGSLNGIIVKGEKITPETKVPIPFDQPIEICVFKLVVSPIQDSKKDSESEKKEESNRRAEKNMKETEDVDESADNEAVKENKEQSSAPAAKTETTRETPEKPETDTTTEQEKNSKENTPKKAPSEELSDSLDICYKATEDLEEIEFIADEILTLSGRIHDSNDQPIAEVVVNGGELGTTESDKEGTFSFPEILENNPYKLSFAKSGFKFDPPEISGTLEEDLEIQVSARKLGSIKGRVIHNENPLPEVKIETRTIGQTKTDNKGRFEFTDLVEGSEHEINFNKKDFKFEPESVKAKATEDASEITVNATRLVTVKGRITHKGKPLDGVEVDAGILGKTTTDSEGVYVFENVPEGTESKISVRKAKYHFTPQPKKS